MHRGLPARSVSTILDLPLIYRCEPSTLKELQKRTGVELLPPGNAAVELSFDAMIERLEQHLEEHGPSIPAVDAHQPPNPWYPPPIDRWVPLVEAVGRAARASADEVGPGPA